MPVVGSLTCRKKRLSDSSVSPPSALVRILSTFWASFTEPSVVTHSACAHNSSSNSHQHGLQSTGRGTTSLKL